MVEPVFKKYNYVEAIDNEYKRRVLQQTNSQLITSHPRPKVAQANFSIKLFALYTESRPTTLWKYTSKNGQWKDVSPSPGENNLKEMLIANVGGKYKTVCNFRCLSEFNNDFFNVGRQFRIMRRTWIVVSGKQRRNMPYSQQLIRRSFYIQCRGMQLTSRWSGNVWWNNLFSRLILTSCHNTNTCAWQTFDFQRRPKDH